MKNRISKPVQISHIKNYRSWFIPFTLYLENVNWKIYYFPNELKLTRYNNYCNPFSELETYRVDGGIFLPYIKDEVSNNLNLVHYTYFYG